MFIAYPYSDYVLGIFTTKEKALNALVEYHGSEEAAQVFGYIGEHTPDTFLLYKDGVTVTRNYADEGQPNA